MCVWHNGDMPRSTKGLQRVAAKSASGIGGSRSSESTAATLMFVLIRVLSFRPGWNDRGSGEGIAAGDHRIVIAKYRTVRLSSAPFLKKSLEIKYCVTTRFLAVTDHIVDGGRANGQSV